MKRVLILLAVLMTLVMSGCSGSSSTSNGGDSGGGGGATTPVSIPDSILRNCMGFLVGGSDEISTISTAGGAWARPHPGPFAWGWIETSDGDYNFTESEKYIVAAEDSDVAILGTIWPYADWDQISCHGTECQVTSEDQFYPKDIGDGIPTYRCAPCDMNGYKEFLTNLVERYDGDGTDDMNDLTIPIKYWEVLNEPSMNSDDLKFFIGTQTEYEEILRESYNAIKAACADCIVLHGGASGIDDDTLNYWSGLLDIGIGSYFDIGNIHYINAGDVDNLNVQAFDNLLRSKSVDKDIWVTEAELASESEILGSAEGAINAGAKRIFFNQFQIGEYGTEGGYSSAYTNVPALCP